MTEYLISRIPSKVFIALSKAIENIFPGESTITYYTPYTSENGISVPISGTLWSHYNYITEKLRSKNLLEKPKSRVKTQDTISVPPPGKISKLRNIRATTFDLR